METMSIAEFRDHCRKSGYSCFVYDTDNQTKYDIPDLFSASFRFRNIHFSINPDKLMLGGDDAKMVFDHVESVTVYDKKPCVGTCFEIMCKHNGAYCRHNLIAD